MICSVAVVALVAAHNANYFHVDEWQIPEAKPTDF